MSGVESCAMSEPSTYSTSEWMMLCGWITTSMARGATSNSQRASITSRPLFIMVAETTEIKARWLFEVAPRAIDVVIHPQSIIHSLVEYVDGSLIAQLSTPDMRVPIAYALAWPERIASGAPRLDLAALKSLSFEPPDERRFPCLPLAYAALE